MKYKMTCIAILIAGLGGLHAQEAAVSAGAEATGVGGSSSYSIGQVVYTAQSGAGGTVKQGVQQSYDIATTLGAELENIALAVYPNPTSDYLNLSISDNDLSSLTYVLYDLQGRTIASQKVTANTTAISMQGLASAAYILKISQNNNPLKTYRIIKN